MQRTETPVLDTATLERLETYSHQFHDLFRRREQARLTRPYLQGLLTNGERKSVEPMVARIGGWEKLGLTDPVQAVRHFVGHGYWDHEPVLKRYRDVMMPVLGSPDGILLVDDSGNRKQGVHSVGVQRQYYGAEKEIANCQVAVTVHYVSPKGHCPLDARLFLPESWTNNPKRLDEAKVPPEYRSFVSKSEIALELVERMMREGIPASIAMADAAYGSSTVFRKRLVCLGLLYVVGVKADVGVFVAEPQWDSPESRSAGKRGPRPSVPRLAEHCRPVSVAEAAKSLKLRRCVWREGTKGKMAGRFARMRVWPARRAHLSKGLEDLEGPVWLVVEKRGKERRYYLSNLPEDTTMLQMVRLVKSRWPIEQGYQQLKEELGFDHFEGRRWAGFHHHACLTFLAFGFLELERQRLLPKRATTKKKVPYLWQRPSRSPKSDSPRCPPCATGVSDPPMRQVRPRIEVPKV
jgi:SRSO17 transposase